MLRREDNELVTRVGPGTPMGTLMREYWIPVLFSTELAQPDAPPLRVRLSGRSPSRFAIVRDKLAWWHRTAHTGVLRSSLAVTRKRDSGASITAGSSTPGGLRGHAQRARRE